MPAAAARARTVSVATYRDDPLYPRIERAVAALFANGKVVAPVDVLVRMGLLAPDRLEQWRLGRIAYPEQVVDGNLTRPSRLLRASDTLRLLGSCFLQWVPQVWRAARKSRSAAGRRLEHRLSARQV
jgi:hypothetical protein